MMIYMEASWAAGSYRIKSLAQQATLKQLEAEGFKGQSVEYGECGGVNAIVTNDSPGGTRRDAAWLRVYEDGSVEVVA